MMVSLGLGLAACAQGVSDDDFGAGGEGGSAASCAALGLEDCGGACVDTDIDAAHCGSCDHACPPGLVCQAGQCQSCPSGETSCGGVCVDLASDPDNCNTCGHVCAPGQTCSLYVCTCGSGLTSCPDGCFDTLSDEAHCGNCDIACAPGQICSGGFCNLDCAPLANCFGACVDLTNDPDNCQTCGHACGPDQTCTASTCTCTGGLDACPDGCFDTLTDATHCGSCVDACPPGQQCSNGSCGCVGGMCGACGLTDLGSAVPQTASGSNVGAADSLTPGCGLSGGSDVSYTFTAPATATYVFDTVGSSFDTVLHVHASSCAELACNDDYVGVQSQLSVPLAQGEQVLVVVDGYGSASGSYTLHVSELPPCPETDLGSTVPQTTSGTNAGGAGNASGSCGGYGAEQTYAFTAPSAGTYLFDTVGSAFDTVLYLLDGVCGGVELACDDEGGGGGTSFLAAELAAGQTVVVVVDAQSSADAGAFELHVSPAPACPDADLGSTVPQSVADTTQGALPVRSGSCGGAGPERSFTFTAPATGDYVLDTVGTAFDTVLHVRDGGCGGAELACDDQSGGANTSMAVLSLTAGQTVVVLVDGAQPADAGPFTLHVSPAPPCPARDLGSAVPQTATDTTAGLAPARAGSCGGTGSPEASFLFTAPAAGAYAFDTAGSAFDTVLYARGASCSGAELACNDEGPGIGPASQLVLLLAAGEQVVLFVDGKGASGDVTLNVKDGCPESDLGTSYPATVSGSTVSEPNLWGGGCGGSGAPEHTFAFEATAAGTYTFDTVGSSFDTLLYVRDTDCNGAELGCNDDTYGLQSEVVVTLAAGQRVVVFVDGFSSGSGDYVLNVVGP
ncbi:MAG: hypothetical protein HY908_06175 [Myxococcales bacterium]|nr:hypothetical protein [Myxococcales bacterium]